ncbi:hypothetical protein QPK87_18155 [Kamptonema cortianum]|nr:hypothetical protein [Geitlerinema splendidum]MDK3158480.1 hypothetical protein [Kamptonema cortianum]
MGSRVLLLAGAGNIDCAHYVLATLATWHSPDRLEVRLFDANEERLDLMDRLARFLFEDNNDEAIIKASASMADFADGCTDIVLSLSEDCARRMTGKSTLRSLEFLEEFDDPYELRRGDRNKPTRAENLSESVKQLLEVPEESDLTLSEVLRSAAKQIVPVDFPRRHVACLSSNGVIGHLEGFSVLGWPDATTEPQIAGNPHQVLRWIRGDDLVGDLLDTGRENPLRAWLDRKKH